MQITTDHRSFATLRPFQGPKRSRVTSSGLWHVENRPEGSHFRRLVVQSERSTQ